jgi:hypothetical protein
MNSNRWGGARMTGVVVTCSEVHRASECVAKGAPFVDGVKKRMPRKSEKRPAECALCQWELLPHFKRIRNKRGRGKEHRQDKMAFVHVYSPCAGRNNSVFE